MARGSPAGAREALARGDDPKPVLSCFMGSHGVPEGLRSLHESEIPSYAFPESAAIALARAVRYGRWRREPEGTVPRFAVDRERAAQVIAGARTRAGDGDHAWLDPGETTALLAAYGIATPAARVAPDEERAVAAARAIGYPVVLKLVSATITHKSEVGGVALDLRSDEDVRAAYRRLEQRLEALGQRQEMEGVLIQPMLREGLEAIVGMTQDPSFGPLLMFGLGGIQVELLKDVAFRIHPLTDRDARELVRSIKGFPLLEGWRGAPAGDVAAIEETLLRVSQLAGEHPEVAEMDLNPLRVLPPGKGCLVVDARIAVRR
jgi:acyl-CoA synthetase (NDP forming)